jgi:CheY-like chemotaxis protein/HPt (histidine-containing phosphotransfer) domain-containing protein
MPKILIAEDYMFNYLLLQRFLKKLNCEFVVCDNGQKALEELQKQDFDLVLMDIEMPVMNGIEAVQHIRNLSDENKNKIPIIALTGHQQESYFGNLNKAGFDDCLIKPIDLNDLEKKLFSYLSDKELQERKAEEDTYDPAKEISLEYLNEFSEGEIDFVIEMIDVFLENAPVFLSKIDESYKTNDWETLRYSAHKYSPQLAFFGLKTIIKEVDEIEEYAVKQIFSSNIQSKIDRIKKYSYMAIEKLKQLKEKLKNLT